MNVDGRPRTAHPDRHYWRRRANRRVRKARLTRGAFRWTVILTLNLLLGAVIVIAVSRVHLRLLHSDEFALRNVELLGAVRVRPDDVRERLQPFLDANLLDLDLARVAASAADTPGVLQVSARRVLPDTLRIELVEREPCAVAVIGRVPHVVDTTGFVLGPATGVEDRSFPVLTGLEGMQDDTLIVALRRGTSIVQRLRKIAPEWLAGVAELSLAHPDRVEIRTLEPGPVIALDPERIDRNLGRYFALQGAIDRRVGGVDYVDLRWQDRISVVPTSDIPSH